MLSRFFGQVRSLRRLTCTWIFFDILTMICDHKKAGVALIKKCHADAKTKMDFLMAEG